MPAGSFGFECLSREASRYFVEKDPDALINLKKTLKILKFKNKR